MLQIPPFKHFFTKPHYSSPYLCLTHELASGLPLQKSASKFSLASFITDSNKTFRSRSRGKLIDSDPDSESWLVATTPGDSDAGSDSDSAPLTQDRRVWQTG